MTNQTERKELLIHLRLAVVLVWFVVIGCIVPGPHGGPSVWFPGAGLVWYPGKSEPDHSNDWKYFSGGDVRSIQTALVIVNCRNQKQVNSIEAELLFLNKRDISEHKKIAQTVGNREYHVFTYENKMGEQSTLYFDVTNALKKT